MTVDPLVTQFRDAIAGATTPEDLQTLAYLSPAVHFACFVTIKDKNNRIRPPIPNVLQLRMSQAYETMRRMKVKIRIIVTKPRRAGCSTFGTHIVYHHGMREPIEGIAISDTDDHSAEMLEKIKAYGRVDTFPWGHNVIRDPNQSIAWDNGTKWTIDSAEASNPGVGGTRQCGFFSEVSKWPQTHVKNDKKVMATVLPSLSGSDTVAIAESTPERASGWQYATWQEAVSLEDFIKMHEAGICPEEQWVKVFAAWFEFDDNRREKPVMQAEIDQIKRTMTERERKGIEKYGWDWEQVAWRRDTLKSVCHGDEKTFDFYYPEDEFSCWLAGGTPRFDMAVLCKMEAKARSVQPETGSLVIQGGEKLAFIPDRESRGEILVWEKPKEGLRYLVTIDPATDETQTIGADPDRHSVSVWRAGYDDKLLDRWMKPKKVARVKPPFYADGDRVAELATKLSRWYGGAMVSMEVNCGLDILRLLRAANVSVGKRRPFSHRDNQIVEQYGFKLKSQEERNAVIEGFAAAIRTEQIEVFCEHSIGEYKAFIVTNKGRAEAGPGFHDDDVMADAMAWETLPSATEYRRQKGSYPDPPDLNTWKKVVKSWG